jgi:hypothetical protein
MRSFGKSGGGGRRGAQRAQAPLLALVSTVVNVHRAAIMNLSRTGAQLSAPDLPNEGQDLVFRADSVQAFGKVVWARGNQCGIAFQSPLAAPEVERLRRAADLPTVAGLSIQDGVPWSPATSE